jgi:hypothetical protein
MLKIKKQEENRKKKKKNTHIHGVNHAQGTLGVDIQLYGVGEKEKRQNAKKKEI